jgi:hypothetical protein
MFVEKQRGEAMYHKKCSLVFVCIFLFLVLIMSAMAEDISGTWIAKTPRFNVTIVFKVDGTALTGTVMTHPSDKTEIKEGKIKGDKISFYIERLEHQKKIKIRFKGTIVGDEINLTRYEKGTLTDLIAQRKGFNVGKERSKSSNPI